MGRIDTGGLIILRFYTESFIFFYFFYEVQRCLSRGPSKRAIGQIVFTKGYTRGRWPERRNKGPNADVTITFFFFFFFICKELYQLHGICELLPDSHNGSDKPL